jgi:hypothetical protein
MRVTFREKFRGPIRSFRDRSFAAKKFASLLIYQAGAGIGPIRFWTYKGTTFSVRFHARHRASEPAVTLFFKG